MKKKTLYLVATAILQCFAVGWLIYRYERVVRCGTQVRFLCRAHDPYDPFRGSYLSVDASQSVTNVGERIKAKFKGGGRAGDVFARIEEGTNGLWRVAEVSSSPRENEIWIKPNAVSLGYSLDYSEKKPDEKWDDFMKRRKASGVRARVFLPDQLFLNENIAPAAEAVLAEAISGGKRVEAVYRVLDREIVITDVKIDGKSVSDVTRDALRAKSGK